MKENQKGCKTAKGIRKNVIRKDIKHADNKNTLFNNDFSQNEEIGSVNHQLGSYELNKVSMSCFDDKRYDGHYQT